MAELTPEEQVAFGGKMRVRALYHLGIMRKCGVPMTT